MESYSLYSTFTFHSWPATNKQAGGVEKSVRVEVLGSCILQIVCLLLDEELPSGKGFILWFFVRSYEWRR